VLARQTTSLKKLLLAMMVCAMMLLAQTFALGQDRHGSPASLTDDSRKNELVQTHLRQEIANALHAKTAAQLEAIAKRYPDPPQELLNLLSDSDPKICYGAAFVIARMGPRAQSALPVLAQNLKSDNRYVRGAAFTALKGIGPSAIPVVTDALRDKSGKDRGAAAMILASMGPAAIPVLVEQFKDEDRGIAYTAAAALGQVGASAVPTLIKLFTNPQTDDNLRSAAGVALLQIRPAGFSFLLSIATDQTRDVKLRVAATRTLAPFNIDESTAAVAVPTLVKLLTDPEKEVRDQAASQLKWVDAKREKVIVPEVIGLLKNGNADVRAHAADILGHIAPAVSAVSLVGPLTDTLKDQDRAVAEAAANALGDCGADAEDAIPALISMSKKGDWRTAGAAADALAKIAEGLRITRRTSAITQLKQAEASLEEDRSPFLFKAQQDAQIIKDDVAWLELLEQRSWEYKLIVAAHAHPRITLGLGFYFFLMLFCVGLLLWSPLTILKLNHLLLPYAESELVGKLKLPLSHILLVGFVQYHPRVLNAWVRKHVATVQEGFCRFNTVRDREIHIEALPLIVDGKATIGPVSEQLRAMLTRKRICVLVYGEGGSGKTSLACQIAKCAMSEDNTGPSGKHPLLPVLLEEDLKVEGHNGRDILVENVRGQLRHLINDTESPHEGLVQKLLSSGRILVIIDGFSERSEVTRNKIRPADPDFVPSIVVITSRFQEKITGIEVATVSTARIAGNRLSSFMEAYLTRRGFRDQFSDSEFFDGCKGLSLMVGERNITVFLAKLYAEQMISRKERQAINELPSNIPDLMLSYLNELNRVGARDGMDDRSVQCAAKAVAWECVRQTYTPTTAKVSDVLAVLAKEHPADQLRILEKRLQIIQTIGSARDRIKFTLDPLAEYLAALQVVELHQDKPDAWRKFLTYAKRVMGDSGVSSSFLRAVRDCCVMAKTDFVVPEFVDAELGTLLGAASTTNEPCEAPQEVGGRNRLS